jgi:hypothetical protein
MQIKNEPISPYRIISVVLLLGILYSAFGIGNVSAIRAAEPTGLSQALNLDDDASQWGVFTEVPTPSTPPPTWQLNNVSSPSQDGRSLRCAITGGVKYSNVHCYRNLPAKPAGNTFALSTSFFYQPTSTFNNVGGPSIVQALEFTMNKWNQGLRYEWALQWDNVDPGAPKWRYWGPATLGGALTWVDLGIAGSLAGQQWHSLTIEGEILNGQVHYQRFILDSQVHPIDIMVPPAVTPGEADRLAVAVQLDGNSTETPYELFIDHVVLKASTFADVPLTHAYWQDIEILYANGLTAGCATNPLKFCPDQTMNRGETAVFMLRANFGSSFVPGPAAHIFKDDWNKGNWAEPWAEAMYFNGLSAGCSSSPRKYCPWDQIPREQAVIFALRMKYGTSYIPPAATGTFFADLTDVNYFATSWAEQAYKDGLIPNCGTNGGKPMFCPKALVSRGLGAYMIVRAKNLTMP